MRQHVATIGTVWAIATALTIALALRAPILPTVASREGVVSDQAFMTLLVLAIPVFFLVQVVLLYSAMRFRVASSDRDGPPVTGHRLLEWTWVGASFVLVLALAAFGWRGMDEMRAAGAGSPHAPQHAAVGVAGSTDLRVKVIGAQFAWRYEYPDLGLTSVELRVPKDRVVRFEITSVDVLHSFWIPAFRMKQDAVPGRTITMAVTPTAIGRYATSCTALCGAGHTVMRSTVEVMEPLAFDAWVAQQRAAAAP